MNILMVTHIPNLIGSLIDKERLRPLELQRIQTGCFKNEN
jgi:hypothetical protein